MLTKIALQNIREKKLRTVLASLSITIGTASLVMFLGLSNGIKNATFKEIEKGSPLTQITVRPDTSETGIISFLNQNETKKLSEESIKQIEQIEGIKNIYPEIQFSKLSSIEANLLGFKILTDSMVFGLEKGFIENDLKDTNIWDKQDEPYPTIIPRKLLDMYNFAIATPQGIPLLSEENLIGKELNLYLNYSTFFQGSNKKGEKIKLEVVGFSDKVNLIGITVPYNLVKDLNNQHKVKNLNYLEIFVETESAEITQAVAEKIDTFGYNTSYFQKNFKEVEAKFKYLSISLGIISLIILLTAGLAIVSTFFATIAERMKEIGLFRALGATKKHIKKIILIEAGLIGLMGSLTGVILGIIGSQIIDKYGIKQLENTTFTPETLFNIDIKLISYTIIFGILLSMLSAYLPARKAANIKPIKALKNN